MLKYITRDDPSESDKCLICFTDGACNGNGQKHAKSSFAVVWPEHPDLDGGQLLEGNVQTNNRAEFSALIMAMRQADILDPDKRKTLIVYTDSMLLVNSVVDWMSGWKKRGWRKADGSPVANIDLLQLIDDAHQTRKIVLRHVRAHTGKKDWESTFNDKVDKLARSFLQ